MDTVAVVGMGDVGAAAAYAMMIEGVAGRYVLVDANAPKARAHGLDLEHGKQFCNSPCELVSGGLDLLDRPAATSIDVVVIAAGAKQHPGETRLDLAARNAVIVRTVVPRLLEWAANAVFVLVINPVDVMTMLATELAARAGIPSGRIIGSGTVLDSSRLRSVLAERLDVSVHNVHAVVVGEHGDSEVPLWSSATIQTCPIQSYRPGGNAPLGAAEQGSLMKRVVGAAYEIIAGKGATSLAIGLSVSRICRAILRDERAVLTVSSQLDRFGPEFSPYVSRRSCYSVPTVIGRRGVVRIVHETPLDQAERAALERSAEIIARSFAELPGG